MNVIIKAGLPALLAASLLAPHGVSAKTGEYL